MSGRRLKLGLVVVAASLAVTPQALGQALERNLPPPPAAPPTVLPQTTEAQPSNDATPLGPALKSIVVLSEDAQPVTAPPAEAVRFVGPARIDSHAGRDMLGAYLGQPLSRKLISEIETRIVRLYRQAGYPFVSVSTPAQEITGGVLQIRVVEFHAGEIVVAGAPKNQARRIAAGIRLKSGEPIQSAQVIQDLDWLNRYPFRTLTPAVTAGAAFADTDLTFTAQELKPWRVYAGYANSGTKSTQPDRIFVGGMVGGLLGPDSLISGQITGSPDFWYEGGVPFSDGHPYYKSAAIQVSVPTLPRQAIEATVDGVESNEIVQVFQVRQQTFEVTADYRSAVSNILPLPGDVAAGVEFNTQTRHTFFGTLDVFQARADVFQVFASWSDAWQDPTTRWTASVSLHGSPGRFDSFNTGDAFNLFSNGRVTHAGYLYGDVDLTAAHELPHGFSLVGHVSAQYAGKPIPDSEQMGIGGASAVRGYQLDDGAFDDAVVAIAELHGPTLGAPWKSVPLAWQPYAFLDGGYGYSDGAKQGIGIESIGLGVEASFTRAFAAGVSLAHNFAGGVVTAPNGWRFDLHASVSY